MEISGSNGHACGRPAVTRFALGTVMLGASRVVLLAFALCVPQALGREPAAPMKSALEAALRAPPPPPEEPATTREIISLVALAVGCIFVAVKVVPKIPEWVRSQLNPWDCSDAKAAELSSNELAEQRSFSEFATTLHTGPVGPVIEDSTSGSSGEFDTKLHRPKHERNLLLEFFAQAPWKLTLLRNLGSAMSKASNEKARPQILSDIFRELRAFKELSAIPEMLPVWQLTSALEGLLKQLIDKASNVTPSTLQTTSAAMALLQTLSVKGLKTDLITSPPVRLLVVDDDPISRLAVASALKKVFNPPDVASGGEEALAFTAKNSYHVIFLDVEMPGMDGFELCKKIRETEINQKTPVVFVTCHGDFESRAKSTRSGGQDLIAKPFLSFEIAVKALTLVLGSRVQPAAKPASPPAATTLAAPAKVASEAGPLSDGKPEATGSGAASKVDALRASADVFARAFFECAPAHIESIRNQLKALVYAGEDAVRADILGELYVSVHALTAEAERAELRAASRLGATLQSLLKKMLDNRRHVTTSTLVAVDGVLDAFEHLCSAAINLDLAEPEIRILVVDDDPIARRSISAAIQLAFPKPETADTGDEAVAAAEQTTFDVIFLDVEMPGMDGYAACVKIRKTALNSRTPVVFVTSHSDMESRAKAALAGGSDLLPKPAMPIEVSLRALSFALRARLDRRQHSELRKVEAAVS